jgi:Nucleotide modification associated domain 2
MRISDVLDFDAYYRDGRFAEKKASNRGWRERCGDNIYFRNEDGDWIQGVAFSHTSPESIEQDTRNPRVFVSDHFYYFGEAAPEMPVIYRSLLQTRQGCTYHEGEVVDSFIAWLQKEHTPGVLGAPRDRNENVGNECVVAEPGCDRSLTSRYT